MSSCSLGPLLHGSCHTCRRSTSQGRPVVCLSVEDVKGCAAPTLSRRQILETCSVAAGFLWATPSGLAAQYQRGISRYVRTKQLDDLESYVPLVIEARSQLQKAGAVMDQDAQSARLLLRDGAFSGLRDNIKALGTYAVRADSKDSKLADNFFSAIQSYDFTLQKAVKSSKPVPGEAKQQLDVTMKALDRLLATVPKDIMERSEDIIANINGGPIPDSESEAAIAADKFREAQIEQFLLK